MRIKKLGLFILAGLIAACQTPITTHHEYDREARFGEYKSFAWITEDPLIRPVAGVVATNEHFSPFLEKEIRGAVNRNLRARGFQRIRVEEQPDLVLSFSIGARDKIRVDSYPASAGYRHGRHHSGGWVTNVHSYTEGILVIDVFDRGTKQVVWHGWATKRLSPQKHSEKRKAAVDRVVDSLLEEFPEAR